MLPIRIDARRWSFSSMVELLSPLLPGITLIGGLFLVRPELTAHAFAPNGVGYHTRVVTLVFIAYGLGLLVTYTVTAMVLGACGAIAGLIDSHAFEPWRKPEWQRLAGKFLGAELSGKEVDADWEWWCALLQLYHSEVESKTAIQLQILGNAMATGAAILLVVLCGPEGHETERQVVAAITGVCFLVVAAIFGGYCVEASRHHVAAELLRAIKKGPEARKPDSPKGPDS